jgi:hypothetical protein
LVFLQGHEELLFYEAAVPLLKEKRRHFGEDKEKLLVLEGLVGWGFYEEGADEGFVHEEREGVEGGLGSGSDGGEGGFWRRERPEGLF